MRAALSQMLAGCPVRGSSGSGCKKRFSSANIAATWRLVLPWMRVSAQCSSQWSRYARLFQALETLAFQRRLLGMADALSDFSFLDVKAIGISPIR